MRKLFIMLFTSMLIFALSACNDDSKKGNTSSSSTNPSETSGKNEKTEESSQKLEDEKIEDSMIVAVVNGKEIKGTEYNEYLTMFQQQMQQTGQDPTTKAAKKQLKENTLNSLVGQSLLMEEVNKLGYKATDQEINEEVEKWKSRFDNNEAFERALKENNLTINDLREQISDNIKSNKYIDNELNVAAVTDIEVKQYYDTLIGEGNEDTPKYDEIKDTLKIQLQQNKIGEKLDEKVAELRKEAKIEIRI